MRTWIGLLVLALVMLCVPILTSATQKGTTWQSARILTPAPQTNVDVAVAMIGATALPEAAISPPVFKTAGGDATLKAKTVIGQGRYSVLKFPMLSLVIGADSQDCDVGPSSNFSVEVKIAQAGTAWPTSALVNDPVKMLNALA